MIKYVQCTDMGPRKDNQDSLNFFQVGDSYFAAVADGVGGYKGGKKASQTAVSHIGNFFKLNLHLKGSLLSAHDEILELASRNEELSNMATTFTGCTINDMSLSGVHSGDSRLYVLRKNGIKQLTEDHTEVAKLIKKGKLTHEEAINYPRKNVLYSALGATTPIEEQEFYFKLCPNDRIILLTDGVSACLTKKQIRDLSIDNNNIEEFANAIVDKVNEAGPKDNFTFIIIEIS